MEEVRDSLFNLDQELRLLFQKWENHHYLLLNSKEGFFPLTNVTGEEVQFISNLEEEFQKRKKTQIIPNNKKDSKNMEKIEKIKQNLKEMEAKLTSFENQDAVLEISVEPNQSPRPQKGTSNPRYYSTMPFSNAPTTPVVSFNVKSPSNTMSSKKKNKEFSSSSIADSISKFASRSRRETCTDVANNKKGGSESPQDGMNFIRPVSAGLNRPGSASGARKTPTFRSFSESPFKISSPTIESSVRSLSHTGRHSVSPTELTSSIALTPEKVKSRNRDSPTLNSPTVTATKKETKISIKAESISIPIHTPEKDEKPIAVKDDKILNPVAFRVSEKTKIPYSKLVPKVNSPFVTIPKYSNWNAERSDLSDIETTCFSEETITFETPLNIAVKRSIHRNNAPLNPNFPFPYDVRDRINCSRISKQFFDTAPVSLIMDQIKTRLRLQLSTMEEREQMYVSKIYDEKFIGLQNLNDATSLLNVSNDEYIEMIVKMHEMLQTSVRLLARNSGGGRSSFASTGATENNKKFGLDMSQLSLPPNSSLVSLSRVPSARGTLYFNGAEIRENELKQKDILQDKNKEIDRLKSRIRQLENVS